MDTIVAEHMVSEYKRYETLAKRTFWTEAQEKAYFDAPFQLVGSMPYMDAQLQERIRTMIYLEHTVMPTT